MGELIHNIFILKNISDTMTFFSIAKFYKDKVGAINFLYVRKFPWLFYNFLTWISYIALFLIIFFIVKEFLLLFL